MDAGQGPPMILPKGIVVNTKNTYKEVAAHLILPEEKIIEYWRGKCIAMNLFLTPRSCTTNAPIKVYTTTNKNLKDPTACRLEHFWWHVWGSDRRLLSGEKLARLFEDISTGPTFVPLRSVANRWEGPDVGDAQNS